MMHINWFCLGASVDFLAAVVAVSFMLSGKWRFWGGASERLLCRALSMLCGWVALAFLLRSFGQEIVAATMLWLPGAVLLGFGLMNLLYAVFQPRT